MKKACFLAAIVVVFLVQPAVRSQSGDLPKFEVAAEFTTLEREATFTGRRTEPGFGGRFTYNVNRVFSLEGAAYFFPRDCFECESPGRAIQVLGGVKVGKRFEKWGVFAKARPGVFHHTAHFGGVVICLNNLCARPTEADDIETTHFAADIGGVVEFYPSRRIVTRFDAGDTIIYFRRLVTDGVVPNTSGGLDPFQFITPSRTAHNFQFMASVGFRF